MGAGANVNVITEEEERALQTLDERQGINDALRSFIQGHREALRGLLWNVHYAEAQIEIDRAFHEGVKRMERSGREIARRWPGLTWKRALPEFGWRKEEERDWIAEVDGVTLRIRGVEVYKPIHIPKCGEKIELEEATHA